MVKAAKDLWGTWSPSAPTEEPEVEVSALDVPKFSVAERDRRWGAVRDRMREAGIDVIVAPSNTGLWDQLQANVRYLTGIGGGGEPVAAVFPVEGEVTAIPGPMPFVDYWLAFQDWVTDIRPCFFDTTAIVIDRIKELSLERGRIGIAGLELSSRHPDGLIPHRAFTRLEEAFPHAELVNATFLLDEVRFVKSEEEIAFMQAAVQLAEGALEQMRDVAEPGVDERVVYAKMIEHLVANGSEIPSMLLWAAGTPHPPAISMLPVKRRLQSGDVIATEVEARWAGYIGQVTQTAVVGPVSDEYASMFELQQAATRRCYEELKPGVPLGEFAKISEEVAEGTPFMCRVIIHSRGCGDDAPLIVFGSKDRRMLDWEVAVGATLIVKPQVRLADGSKPVYWGDVVVVTEDGAQRLGSRTPEMMSLGS